MNAQVDKVGEQLESAFELFNQFSEKLSGSYSDLEGHVARLTRELAEARSERLLELAEKEVLANKLEGLLDALPAGIVVLDSHDCIIQTNPIARIMLGVNENSGLLTGKNWDRIAKATILADGDELRLKNGRWIGRWVSLSSRSLNLNDAVEKNHLSGTGKIILLSDVSETRTLQNKLNRQERLSALGEMVAGLAHQIRTPLASALLYVTTLNHPLNNTKDRHDYAEKATERLHHLEKLVNDMLIFARGDISQSECINSYDFMVKLNELLKSDCRIKGMELALDERLKAVSIQANHDALLSAIQNIIDNAIEACAETSRVEASIEIKALLNNKDQFEITISDSGCGMSEETKKKILEPFFTTRSSGTGLGLSVVSSTISRYQGVLNIETKEGVGTTFNIKFPRAEVVALLPSNLSVVNNSKDRKMLAVVPKLQVENEQEVVL